MSNKDETEAAQSQQAQANTMDVRDLRDEARDRWYNRYRCMELAIQFNAGRDTAPADIVATAAVFQKYLDGAEGYFTNGVLVKSYNLRAETDDAAG